MVRKLAKDKEKVKKGFAFWASLILLTYNILFSYYMISELNEIKETFSVKKTVTKNVNIINKENK